MGNYCCPNKDEKDDVGQKPPQTKENKKKAEQNVAAPVDFEFNLQGIQVIVKYGDITKETAVAFVSGTDNYVKNRSLSVLTATNVDSLNKAVAEKRGAAAQEPLLNGEVVITGPGNLHNVQHVIHMSIPFWRGGKHREIEQLKAGYSKILEEATNASISSLMFTDVAASLFGIPKQLNAQALMQAIHEYADKSMNASNKIQTIKFVHKERQTVLIFEDYLKKEVGQGGSLDKSDYSDHLQGSKVPGAALDDAQETNEKLIKIEDKQSINPTDQYETQ